MSRGGAMKVNCLGCGGAFVTYPSRLKRGQGKFCSRKCKGKYQRKAKDSETRECTRCCNEFPQTEEYFGAQKQGKYWDSFCHFCRKEYQKEYYLENKELVNARHRQHYQENRDATREVHKQWHENNKESIRKRENKYREENPRYRLTRNVSSGIYYSLKYGKGGESLGRFG